MITYNPKDWIKLILSFHKSDTFRILLPSIIGIAVFCFVISYIEIEVWQMKYKSTIAMHSLLGFVISMLLVFRTNTAYDRWWEGRKMWGAFVNHSRSFAMKVSCYVPAEFQTEKQQIQALLVNYFIAAKNHLRNVQTVDDWRSIPDMDKSEFLDYQHKPNAVLARLISNVNELKKRKIIDDYQFLTLNDELRSYSESLGACERIKSTPIPYSYSMFIKKIIFFYTLTMPFGFVSDFGYWTILVTTFVFYALASMELIAEEIEDPFGTDSNDLPTDDIALKISQQVDDLFAIRK